MGVYAARNLAVFPRSASEGRCRGGPHCPRRGRFSVRMPRWKFRISLSCLTAAGLVRSIACDRYAASSAATDFLENAAYARGQKLSHARAAGSWFPWNLSLFIASGAILTFASFRGPRGEACALEGKTAPRRLKPGMSSG
jgi:hypothetical protein